MMFFLLGVFFVLFGKAVLQETAKKVPPAVYIRAAAASKWKKKMNRNYVFNQSHEIDSRVRC